MFSIAFLNDFVLNVFIIKVVVAYLVKIIIRSEDALYEFRSH